MLTTYSVNTHKVECVYNTSNNSGLNAHLNYIKLFNKGTQKQGTPALERYRL